MLRATLLALALVLCTLSEAAAQEKVDLELILMADGSGSVDGEEFLLQRRGYARALRQPRVLSAIRNGPLGRIALSYVEWSGPSLQVPIVPWRVIRSAADIEAFAQQLESQPRALQGGGTAVGSAILYGAQSLNENAYDGTRRVIDLSGDGPDKDGVAAAIGRDRAVAMGITVNGLPILSPQRLTLDIFFQDNVIGGPGVQGFLQRHPQQADPRDRGPSRAAVRPVACASPRCGRGKAPPMTLKLLKALSIAVLISLAAGAGPLFGQDKADPPLPQGTEVAIFAGGCFWCVESDFDHVPGVLRTVSGYTGGTTKNPTYEQVGAGGTGHVEAVQIHFDPKTVSYAQLVEVFWHSVDPTDDGGQFCDQGESYKTAIFATSPEQMRIAEASKAALRKSGVLKQPVVTPIRPAGPFYAAEDYHQNYYKTHPIRYRFYRYRCGRDARLRELWGEDALKGIKEHE